MNLGAVMQEVADRLETIDGLRVYGHPPDSVSAPAAVVTYPGLLTFDGTYGRGMDKMDPTVVALIGKVTSRTARDRISRYCNGSGAESFKQILEAEPYTACDTIRVTQVEFDVISMSGVEYLSATFTLDIAGQGA